jgi:hypothetical protein
MLVLLPEAAPRVELGYAPLQGMAALCHNPSSERVNV